MTRTGQIGREYTVSLAATMRGWLRGMNIYLFFLLIFIYHVLVIFQGLDFNDEGFHLAFYQQIFSNPESVQYGFWGWLGGIVCGLFMKIFPFMGIWGIRLLGAIVSTCTIMISYNLLKKYLDKVYLMVSMIMLSLFINEDAKNLYYNNLSAFLYFVSAYFVFLGARDRKNLMIAAAGLFVGLNMFARIPNILGVSLVCALFYYGFLTKRPLKEIATGFFFFLGGVVASLLAVFALMKALHHLDFYIGSIRTLFSTAHGAKDDGLNGAYGVNRLLKNNLTDYARSLRFIVLISGLTFVTRYLLQKVSLKPGFGTVLPRLFNYLVLLGGLVLIFSGWFTSYRLLEFFVGISLLSAIVLFDRKMSVDLKLLTIIGGLITLVHPFGSSEGISTVVVYSLWISFPIAVDYITRLQWLNLDVRIDASIGMLSLKTAFGPHGFRNLKIVTIGLISLACFYNVVRYPYLCDRHNRWEMRYSVNNDHMKGVYTTKARVVALNELLEASSKYVKPNDVVLAYDCMPMYHYMTETRSYVRNPCIWFYTTEMFQKELTYAETRGAQLPVIVRQLIKTTGEGSAWPEERPAEDYLQFKRNEGKNNILNDFIKRHDYKEVWNNGDFIILVPQNK